MSKKILILGGYGNVGRPLARLLISYCREVSLILAGRNIEKGRDEVEKIINETGFMDISSVVLDASDSQSLKRAFQNVDMVVVASSTLKYAENVALAALETQTDYLDIQLSAPAKLQLLWKLEDRIVKSGRIFITDGGFHPGLLSAIVRLANLKVGPLHTANIYGALKIDWSSLKVSKGTDMELVDEFKNFDMTVLREGKWVKTGYSQSVKHDFGEPFFEQDCVPMLIEEMKMLPAEIPELKEAGFYVTGFNKILDYFMFPIIMLLIFIRMDHLAVKLFRYGLTFSKPPFGVDLEAECIGENGKMKIRFSDIDGYKLTAVPVAACIKQYLEGAITKPGLYWQAWVVEPIQFFADIGEMGLDMEIT